MIGNKFDTAYFTRSLTYMRLEAGTGGHCDNAGKGGDVWRGGGG